MCSLGYSRQWIKHLCPFQSHKRLRWSFCLLAPGSWHRDLAPGSCSWLLAQVPGSWFMAPGSGCWLLAPGFWERNSQGEIFYVYLHHSATTIQVWVRPKPGAQNSNLFSHMDGRDPSTWAINCCLTECTLVGSWMGSRRAMAGISVPV